MRSVFVYPTETCYGLGVDATSPSAVKRLYRIKGRSFKKPVHIVVSSRGMAKEYVEWNSLAEKLARAFWPGSLTLVLPAKKHNPAIRLLSAGTGFLGVRMPKHKIPLQIVKNLGRPITATSANVSGREECYSLSAVEQQFQRRKYKPDILIDGGVLRKNKPSTIVKIIGRELDFLRIGPITQKQIRAALN